MTRHSSVAYILSLEIGAGDIPGLVTGKTEPVRPLDQRRAVSGPSGEVQYVVRETDAERAQEIAGEFYPNGGFVSAERVESPNEPSEEGERCARIFELARRLGLNDAKTKMLLGQWAGNHAGLERRLLNEVDEQPEGDVGRKR